MILWSRSRKRFGCNLPVKKGLYSVHLQRIYWNWNGNSFKILLRDIVFLHNSFSSWTFMNARLEGWSGSWVLMYVVPIRKCQGRHFSVRSHMHAGSWMVFRQQWMLEIEIIREKIHAIQCPSLQILEGLAATQVNAFRAWYAKQPGLN